jgi:uncharacterized membrane protein
MAAMTPVGELRLAIPLAIWTLNVPWHQALPVAVLGNILPVLALVPGLARGAALLQRFPNPLGRLLEWRARRLRQVYTGRFQKYGPLALMLFVAVPLPLTGAWTGVLLAWAFQVPARAAILFISAGVVIAGIIVTALVEAGLHIALLLAD